MAFRVITDHPLQTTPFIPEVDFPEHTKADRVELHPSKATLQLHTDSQGFYVNEEIEALEIAKNRTTQACVKRILELRKQGIYPNIIAPLNGSLEPLLLVMLMLKDSISEGLITQEEYAIYLERVVTTLKVVTKSKVDDVEVEHEHLIASSHIQDAGHTIVIDELIDKVGQVKLIWEHLYALAGLENKKQVHVDTFAWLQKQHTPQAVIDNGIPLNSVTSHTELATPITEAPWIVAGWLLNSNIPFNLAGVPETEKPRWQAFYATLERFYPHMLALEVEEALGKSVWEAEYANRLAEGVYTELITQPGRSELFMAYVLMEIYKKTSLSAAHTIALQMISGETDKIQRQFLYYFGARPETLLSPSSIEA